MSNEDPTPPAGTPGEPDHTPSDPAAAPGEPDPMPGSTPPPEPPVAEPTQVIPTVPPPTGTPPPPGAMAGLGDPGAVPTFEPDVENYDLPWYKQPGRLALALFALFAVIGLIILLFWLLSDDDEGGAVVDTESPLSVVVTRLDDGGRPLITEVTGVVTATGAFPDAYVWVVPADVAPGDPAQRPTDASGRAEFRWQAVIGEGTDPQEWSSTMEIGEVVSTERAAAGVLTSCEIERGDGGTPQSLSISVAYAGDEADPAAPRIATYSFPNTEFRPGDRVDCEIQDVPVGIVTTTTSTTVPETTTTSETSSTTTTVPETTTTAAPTTTVAPTTTAAPTTTVAPTTTAAPTTTVAPTTTTTVPTLPPVTPGSALEFLNSRTDLTSFVQLIATAGIADEFNEPTRVFTVFAPDNDAIVALAADPNVPDLTNPGVLRDLIRTHVADGQALLVADIAALPEVAVQFGGPQPVDPGPPLLVGGAEITDIDHQSTSSVTQIIDMVLTTI